MKGMLKIALATIPILVVLTLITMAWMRHNDELMTRQQQQFDREFRAVTEEIMGDGFTLPPVPGDPAAEQKKWDAEQDRLEQLLRGAAAKVEQRGGEK